MRRGITPAHGTNWLQKRGSDIATISNKPLELGEALEKVSQATESAACYSCWVLSGRGHYLFAKRQFVLLSCTEGEQACPSRVSLPLRRLSKRLSGTRGILRAWATPPLLPQRMHWHKVVGCGAYGNCGATEQIEFANRERKQQGGNEDSCWICLLESAQKNTPTNAFYVVNNVPLYKLSQFYCKNIKYQFICIMRSLRYTIYLLSSWGLSCCSLQALFVPVGNRSQEGFPARPSAQSVGCHKARITPCTSASSYLHS